MACLWALLPADQAATVWAGITARAEQDHTPADPRTADQRRADALADLATLYLSGATNIDLVTGQTGRPPTVPGWAQVQVKLSAELLLGTSTEPAQLRGHGPIPTSMAVRIAADAACTWANCAQPRVDLDHCVPYPAGPTAADNLDAKCRHNHRTKQHPHFRTTRSPDGSTTITTPTGHCYTSPPRDHRPPPRKPQRDRRTHAAVQTADPPPF